MSEGERNLRSVLQQPDASQQFKLRSIRRHRQASSTFWLGCAGVTAPRIKKPLIRWAVLTMTLKSCADAWSCKEPFRQVLSQIQDGRCDDYLSRPPR